MHPAVLWSAVRRRPFEPFRLYSTDGSHYDVTHPDMAIFSRRSVVVGLPAFGPDEPFDKLVTLAVIHVTGMEPIPESQTA